MLMLPEVEPERGPWTAEPVGAVLERVVAAARARRAAAVPLPGDSPHRPLVVAVDGRSASGKSTTTALLAEAATAAGLRATVVHTDDVAWWWGFFSWWPLLRDGVLTPVRAGREVAFRPPPWDERDRPGAITVPAPLDLLLVEGVSASHRELADLIDAAMWVQSDVSIARERGIERDGGTPEDVAFWDEWDAAELPLLAADRPWERADVVVCGTPEQPPGHGYLLLGR